jgi:hypothetical protein
MGAWIGEEFGRRCRDAGLTVDDLWLRYVGLGGTALPHEVERFMQGEEPPPDQHNVLVHALNERFVEMGGDHPVPYRAG